MEKAVWGLSVSWMLVVGDDGDSAGDTSKEVVGDGEPKRNSDELDELS